MKTSKKSIITPAMRAKLPRLKDVDLQGDPTVYYRLFHPVGNLPVYYVLAGQEAGDDYHIYVWTPGNGQGEEDGMQSVGMLEKMVMFCLSYEKTMHFKPCRLSKVRPVKAAE